MCIRDRIHRDVKPENVLISDDGDVKIADFGLVRAVAEAKITSTSVILGTAAYLSPEQVGAGDASPRSDVYAVGILAYELLTGTTPFTGDNALTIAYQRMDNDVPAPSVTIAGVPAQFDELVSCATARNPADRYADAQEMGADLEAISEELGLPAFRVPAPRISAQHQAAAAYQSRVLEERTTVGRSEATRGMDTVGRSEATEPTEPPRQHTRELTRERPRPPENRGAPEQPEQFAGIELAEFEWARQRARRTLLLWVVTILTLTGLVAAGAWTLGSNLTGLL